MIIILFKLPFILIQIEVIPLLITFFLRDLKILLSHTHIDWIEDPLRYAFLKVKKGFIQKIFLIGFLILIKL